MLEEALALGRVLDDADITARSLTHLGRALGRAHVVGPPEAVSRAATQLLEDALALRQQLGARRGGANVHTQLAASALGQRAYARAEHLAQVALAI